MLLQADLTAVAPGPLEPDLARRLQVAAEVESRGGATVYRFTAPSVRRALDVGWTAAELHAFVAGVSRTPVPQPLTYLIDDTARTYGTVRVGHAEAFVRADDEAALTELLAHPQAASLGLRRLAPTVRHQHRAARRPAPPAARAGRGTRRRGARRLAARRPTRRPARPDARGSAAASERATRESASVARVVAAIRAGDRAVAERPAGLPGPDARRLDDGAAAGRRVPRRPCSSGTSTTTAPAPSASSTRSASRAGWLTALDHRSEEIRTFAVHRITSVTPVAAP